MKQLINTALAASLAGWLAVANAADDKVYSGVECRVTNTSIEQGFSDQPYYRRGSGIFNASTTARLVVTCPLVRDTVAGHFQGGHVVVLDENPIAGQDVVCRVCEQTVFPFGSNPRVACSAGAHTTGSNPSPQRLALSTLASTVGGQVLWVGFLECEIPPAWNLPTLSGVLGYLIKEP